MIIWQEHKEQDEIGTHIEWTIDGNDRFSIKLTKYLFRTTPYYIHDEDTTIVHTVSSLEAAKKFIERKLS